MRIHEADVIARQATHLVGTLGHVSEGKSTLVRALTGVRTQRHAAEQQRNITIHLGYANCKIWQNAVTGEVRALGTREAAPGPTDSWSLVAHLSFVDCPGHEAYLATMLGGAGVMDTACLIVASNQQTIPQPQTLEHLIAAELTGLERIAVVQNKCDLVDQAGAEVAADKIRALVADTIAGTAPLFPVSAQHGWGVSRVLDWLLALPPPPRDLNAPARLTCVRSFDVNRPGPITVGGAPLAGAVIGGPLETGVLAVGDWLEVRPGLLKRGAGGKIVVQPLVTRVRAIRCENADLPVAVPGSLLAIATDLDPALSASNGMVGQRVGVPGSLPPIVGEITIKFRRLRREEYAFGRHRVGDRLRICSGVATTEGTLVERGESHVVRVRLDRPLCLGVGEQVSVLRRHEEAGRELLEGVGLVRGVEDWPDVATAEGSELAIAPSRTVEWIPIIRPEFSVVGAAAPTYADLLADTMSHREELVDGGRLRLEEPRVERIPRHTVWVNWPAMYEALTCAEVTGAETVSYHSHLREFLESELTTTSSENAEGQLILRGTWRAGDLRGLLRRYVSSFKRCLQCRGYATGLVRVDGTLKVRCARCRCENVTGHTSA
jgi:translation initiation factor 2 subunit 3